MDEKDIKEIKSAVAELRESFEKMDKTTIDKEKEDKINTYLDTVEEKNKEVTAKFVATEKANTELEEKLANMEKSFQEMPAAKAKEVDFKAIEKKLFASFVNENTDSEEIKKLQEEYKTATGHYIDINPTAGYLIAPEYSSELLRTITEITPFKQLARLVTTKSTDFYQPVRTVLVGATWEGEREASTADTSTYSIEKIPLHRLTSQTPASNRMLEYNMYNLEGEITLDAAEAFALAEGDAFINGNGVKKPLGILQDADITGITSAVQSSYNGDDLIKLSGALKTAYTNGIYGLNRTELTFVRILKDGAGRYLWIPLGELAVGKPGTINGRPYVEMPALPDQSTTNIPVIFGDFGRGYLIIENPAIRVIRDIYTRANKDEVLFNWHKYTGGQAVIKEAIKTLTTKA